MNSALCERASRPTRKKTACDRVATELSKIQMKPGMAAAESGVTMREVFLYFLKLGWLAFGGPVGQIGLMHLQVVERRRWLSEDEFLRTLNFCHVLPGPEALQLAIYIGWKKRGVWAGPRAGLLFLVPGFITLTGLAWIYVRFGKRPEVVGILSGFRPVGLALLLAALVRISKATLKGALPIVLAVLAFLSLFVVKPPFILVLIGCGVAFVAWKRFGRPKKGAALKSSGAARTSPGAHRSPP